VQICRVDVRITFANVKRGVNNVCTDPAQIREALPRLPLDEVLALPDLDRALLFASMRITGREASAGEIELRLRIVSELREPMLQDRRGAGPAQGAACEESRGDPQRHR
jgi:hypothetical protein